MLSRVLTANWNLDWVEKNHRIGFLVIVKLYFIRTPPGCKKKFQELTYPRSFPLPTNRHWLIHHGYYGCFKSNNFISWSRPYIIHTAARSNINGKTSNIFLCDQLTKTQTEICLWYLIEMVPIICLLGFLCWYSIVKKWIFKYNTTAEHQISTSYLVLQNM